MVEMSAKQVSAERQVKGAERKVENTKLSCGETRQTPAVLLENDFPWPKKKNNGGLFQRFN